MSNGPIAHWWKSHAPVRVSTPDAHRVCAIGPEKGRGYCGRRSTKTIVDTRDPAEAARVTCTDCIAAARADHHTR